MTSATVMRSFLGENRKFQIRGERLIGQSINCGHLFIISRASERYLGAANRQTHARNLISIQVAISRDMKVLWGGKDRVSEPKESSRQDGCDVCRARSSQRVLSHRRGKNLGWSYFIYRLNYTKSSFNMTDKAGFLTC